MVGDEVVAQKSFSFSSAFKNTASFGKKECAFLDFGLSHFLLILAAEPARSLRRTVNSFLTVAAFTGQSFL